MQPQVRGGPRVKFAADFETIVIERADARTYVRVPKVLEIPATNIAGDGDEKHTYSLRCILHHIGVDAAGHYTATVCHHATKEWIYADDDEYSKSEIWDPLLGNMVTKPLNGVAGFAYVRTSPPST